MNDDGYTLAETLVGLTIVSLVLGGLFAGARVIQRQQGTATRALEADIAERRLDDALTQVLQGSTELVGGSAPSVEAGLAGDGRRWTIVCAVPPCGAEIASSPARVVLHSGSTSRILPLPRSNVRWRYADVGGALREDWPPLRRDDGAPAARLKTILLTDDRGWALTERAPDPVQADCDYDIIARACRPPSGP